ncbi:MAG: hypothetical protein UT66_C0044G0003 [candidate division CPR2 bacterium GW2011_GWC1_39_9]|uniref:DUF4145 domain-containing protein n=1 Tax=candidate division CPR2 bacterium GW2011_GWC2_39_10 TaxID=1618345 RepID=A0A0G0P5J7_UNCC2|nr:MAG: hypothetical protein UT18_C0020G0011 [candidate division CPR2 bacterium GW2011_GWC2_39_10]KKR33133.1 MAG: hypothetical protein UT66_C0044G0003 [candidate division CPR2 bacterium GW2011_GWC1_39_9]
METTFIIILGVILAGIYLVWELRKQGNKKTLKSVNYKSTYLKKEDVELKWQEIEDNLKAGKPSNLSKAILDGDKLIDEALKDIRIAGDTMGDRLKNANNLFEQNLYSKVWEAHKLRNYIAHEMNAIINKSDVEEALKSFKEALVKLGKL